jgi:outer membrane biosynthesis protein TonB
MGARKRTSAHRLSPARACALAATFATGAVLAVAVAPALSDVSPPTTTLPTSPSPSTNPGPSPDPAPSTAPATSTTKAPAPAKKAPAPTPAPAPPEPVQTFAPQPVPAPAPRPAPAATSTHAVKKPTAHARKVKRRAAHTAARTVKPRARPHGVLGARVSKPARIHEAAPVASTSRTSSGGLRHMLLILLFALPALALCASFVPPTLVPHRLVLAWRDSRVNVGLLAASVLLLEGLLYALIR